MYDNNNKTIFHIKQPLKNKKHIDQKPKFNLIKIVNNS